MQSKTLITLITIIALALGAPSQGHAIAISPLPRVDLTDGVATVQVARDDSYWRADIYRVTVDGDSEKLEPAKDVLVSPRMFKAPKTIRIATKLQPDGSQELFYRLVLTQQVKAEGATGILPKFTISIPVVQAPEKPAPSFLCEANGKIHNTGNIHIKAITSGGKPFYILPGATREMPEGLKNEDGALLCAKGGRA